MHGSATSGGRAINYLSPLLAVVVGIFHAALAPVIVIGGVKPNLVLVAVVLVTVMVGFLPGITWGFVAGLTANLLVGDPLGSVPLAMLIVAAVVAGGARILGRAIWIYPVIATFVASIIADAVSIAIGALVLDTPIATLPGELVLAAATLNAAIAAAFLFPARLLTRRYSLDEAPAW